MKKHLVAMVAGLSLAAGSMAARAANVTLTGWAFGSGNTVSANTPVGDYAGWAGGFGGSLSGAGVFDTTSFLTYCIEIEEHFSFSSTAMTNYRVIEGHRYFQEFRGDASIADRLGQLMTYVTDQPSRVADAGDSTSLQLAIWNLVYDTDYSVGNSGSFRDASGFRAEATSLLAGAQALTSRFDIYALQRNGSQDFLLILPRQDVGEVPEPGGIALLAAAAGAALLARRRGMPKPEMKLSA